MRFFQQRNSANTDKPLNVGTVSQLVKLLSSFYEEAIKDLNSTLEDASMKLTVSKPVKTNEAIAGTNAEFIRISIANTHMVLSIRAAKESLQAYLLPAAHYTFIPGTEYASRLKYTLTWKDAQSGWTLDGQQLSENALRLLVLASTNDILKYSQGPVEMPEEGARLKIGELSLTTGLRDLMFEKAQLLADLLAQQENIHSHIAQELHDSVIADILVLKREILERQLPPERIANAFDEIVLNLRAICTRFSSRDVRDWGFWDALCALVDGMSDRASVAIEMSAQQDVPPLPYDVGLQIYRMVQESLNNAIKHANATKIKVSVSRLDNELLLTVEDDGIGFNLGEIQNNRLQIRGGMGIPVLRERTERLSSLGYASTITINATQGKGTSVEIRVDISSSLLADSPVQLR